MMVIAASSLLSKHSKENARRNVTMLGLHNVVLPRIRPERSTRLTPTLAMRMEDYKRLQVFLDPGRGD